MDMTVQAAAGMLRELDNFIILTHKRPDGDTLGSAAALCRALRAAGKTAWLLPNEETTPLFQPYLEGVLAPDGFTPDTIVAVDIASEGLFPKSAEGYKGKVDICIDHHPSNEKYAAYTCVESDRAACGEIIYQLIGELWDPAHPESPVLPQDIALPLYVALTTDTGCFGYANTTPNTHLVAAALMDTGIDAYWVNKRHFQTKSYTRLKVESRMMDTMELHQDGTIAIAAVTLADMSELHAGEPDVEDIAAFPGQLEGVHTGITVREVAPGECKLSLRTQEDLNATAVCALLGGGGHARASGCTVYGTVAEAKAAILKAIEQVQRNG